MTMQIGFIGLGMMGLPMLSNLARAAEAQPEWRILAFDLNDAPFETLTGLSLWGGRLTRAATVQDFAGCDVVITMLPNSAITCAVIEGGAEPGLISVLSPRSTILDMGSSDPTETLRLAPLLADYGISLIDAPVSGGAAKAREGTLAIMVGADDRLTETLHPVLSTMGAQIIATGRPGAAHAMKALNNYVYAAGLMACCEATAIIEAMGLDTGIFTDVLNASSGRNVASVTKLKPFILPRHYAGGFALRLQAKDLALAAKARSVTGIDAPQLRLLDGLWADATRTLPADADNTQIFEFVLAHQTENITQGE